METEQLTTHDKWAKIEIQKEITNILEESKMKTVSPNTRKTMKVLLRTTFIAPSPYIENLEISCISYLTTHPKASEQREKSMR